LEQKYLEISGRSAAQMGDNSESAHLSQSGNRGSANISGRVVAYDKLTGELNGNQLL
jgi:hypothetical protein